MQRGIRAPPRSVSVFVLEYNSHVASWTLHATNARVRPARMTLCVDRTYVRR